MNPRRALVLSCALAALLSASCKPGPAAPAGEHPDAGQAPPASPAGKPAATGAASPSATAPTGDWILLSIEGQAVAPGHPGKQTGLRLDPKASEASGLAVCNQFRGHFELDDAGLRFGPLATTRMACKGGAQEVESKYLKALQDTSRWSRDGERLTLSNAAGKPLLEFVARAQD